MTQRIIRAGEGEALGSVDGCRDRFLIDSKDWGGRFAVVEHLLAPHSIAAPMHRHTKEDEFSLILEGRVPNLSTLLGQFFDAVVGFVCSGRLIQVVPGRLCGSGCLRTNLSGVVA